MTGKATEALTSAAKAFRAAKDRKEELEAELKTVNETITKLEVTTIPQMLDDLDIEKLTIDGVGTIYQEVKVYANVKADDRDGFYELLREKGHGDLIKETVHPQTLMSFAKEQLENGVDIAEEFSGLLTALKVPTARLRRK